MANVGWHWLQWAVCVLLSKEPTEQTSGYEKMFGYYEVFHLQ